MSTTIRCYCSDAADDICCKPPASDERRERDASELAFLLDPETSQWNVAQVLNQCIIILRNAEIRWKQSFEPEESTVNLLSSALDLPWESGYRDLTNINHQNIASSLSDPLAARILTHEERQILHSLLQRRLQHEPIQYLTGKWDFLDHTFAIRAPLLCPRPETEELVLYAVEDISELDKNQQQMLNVLDVGCGTGCIGISVAHIMRERPCKVTAIDLEPIAVNTSAENALAILGEDWRASYNVQLCSAQDWKLDTKGDRYHVVVSNPPYIPRVDMETLEENVVRYESDDALCGGEDGLDVVRVIIRKLKDWCHPGAICWMEVDPSHPMVIHQWLEENQDTLKVEFVQHRKDMFGLDRFVKLRVMD